MHRDDLLCQSANIEKGECIFKYLTFNKNIQRNIIWSKQINKINFQKQPKKGQMIWTYSSQETIHKQVVSPKIVLSVINHQGYAIEPTMTCTQILTQCGNK